MLQCMRTFTVPASRKSEEKEKLSWGRAGPWGFHCAVFSVLVLESVGEDQELPEWCVANKTKRQAH